MISSRPFRFISKAIFKDNLNHIWVGTERNGIIVFEPDTIRYLSDNRILTESVVMRSKTGTVRFIESQHNMKLKPQGFSGGL